MTTMPQSPSSSSSSEAERDALLPCPFCGGHSEFKPYKRDGLTLQCKTLGCVVFNQRTMRYSLEWLREKMAEHWNTRATPPSLPIDFKQASELLEMFGGEAGMLTLSIAEGHSGRGLYAHSSGYLEDGAEFLGVADEEAVPGKQASEREDSPSDRYLRREITWNEYQAISEEAANKPSDTSSTAAPSPHPEEGALLLGGDEGGKAAIPSGGRDQ